MIGLKQTYIKLSFLNIDELIKVRREITNVVKRNKEANAKNAYETWDYFKCFKKNASFINIKNFIRNFVYQDDNSLKNKADQLDNIIDIREYDVPYHVRVSIDLKLNVGLWYSIKGQGYDAPIIVPRPDLVDRPVFFTFFFH